MPLKANFVFWTLFNTKRAELYFYIFSSSTGHYMFIIKIACFFEMFYSSIWIKWTVGWILKMILGVVRPPPAPEN